MSEVAEFGASSALAFSGVEKRFMVGKRTLTALQSIDFSLPAGGITALVGPDGAGKTTLLRLAAGLLLPDAGRVDSFGLTTTADTAELHRQTGYMPQRFGLYEDLSVQENLQLYADLFGIADSERPQRFAELTRMTGLAPFAGRLAGRLSGGMKQKLGLACTLVNRPRLLLLDEPSVGVDPVSRRELWQIIGGLVRDAGTTVLLSTAYMDEAERCDRVIVLNQGRLLRQGTPAEFRRLAADCAYRLSSPRLNRRQIAVRLQGRVADAVIQDDSVRTVFRPGSRPAWADWFGPDEGVSWQAVEPRLEDAFVLLLQAGELNDKPATPSTLTAAGLIEAAAASEAAMIEVDGVDRWFGAFQAVKKLSFRVERGEIFGLLGANGAGKTTTFRMLCGLLPASAGSLRVAGADLGKAAAKARARLGYMSQKFSLYGQLTVGENLSFFARAYGLRGAALRERIAWALAEFGLADFVDSDSGMLAQGYKQRLALACALLHRPDILFLDEPTSGMDPLARREFWGRINRLAGEGVTVLVTTHFMEEAEYCDRLIIMRDGDILAQGSPADIRSMCRTATQAEAIGMEEAFIRLVAAGEAQS